MNGFCLLQADSGLKKKKSSMFSFFCGGDFEGQGELEQWERLLLFK